MKICIPVAGLTGSRVAAHFGRAPRLAIASTDDGAVTIVAAGGHHDGPEGDHHLPQLLAEDVQCVACLRMGRRAFRVLDEAGIAVMVAPHHTVSEMLAAVRAGYLKPCSEDEVCPGAGPGARRRRGGPPVHLADLSGRVRLPR